MSTIATMDGTRLYYKDRGTVPAVMSSHGWPLDADAWDVQTLFLAGHGRSDQHANGSDLDTYFRGLGDASIRSGVIVAIGGL